MPVERAEVLALVKQEIDRLGLVQAKQQLMGAVTLGVLQLALTGTTRKIAFGVQNLTFAAGAGVSNVPTVTHGLGVTPIGVLALQNATGGPSPVVSQAQNVGPATFQLYGEFRAGTWAAGGTIPFFWVAIG